MGCQDGDGASGLNDFKNQITVISATKSPKFSPRGSAPHPARASPWAHQKITFHCTSFFWCTYWEHD